MAEKLWSMPNEEIEPTNNAAQEDSAYDPNKSEPIPAISPTLSPTLSAITCTFRRETDQNCTKFRPRKTYLMHDVGLGDYRRVAWVIFRYVSFDFADEISTDVGGFGVYTTSNSAKERH